MKDRIRKLLLSEGLTSGAFADEIGVQRSSLSHILNGRNNPSLDFVMKTKNRFPKLNLSWLIMGDGDMYTPDNQGENNSFKTPLSSPTIFSNPPNGLEDQISYKVPEPTEFQDDTPEITGKQVSQIVIFYSDKTFSAYAPEN